MEHTYIKKRSYIMKQNEDSSQDIDKYLEDMAASGWFSIMLICMQGKTQDGVYGHICSYYLKDPVPFTGTGDMVLKMDEICNWLGAPQRTTDPRFMNKEMKKRYESAVADHPQGLKDRMLERSSLVPFPEARKAKEVLIAIVKYRQNSTMQGSIRGRLTNSVDVNFRSALELMRMVQMIEIV